jgi:hypothetical protein
VKISYIESANPREENQKQYNLDIKVPIQYFDVLMESLNSNMGNIDTKDIQVSGHQYQIIPFAVSASILRIKPRLKKSLKLSVENH